MPVTVVVGGQFGSEGKGKVAHFLAKEMGAEIAVRVGGSNSGHTVIGANGQPMIFRHLPTAALLPDVTCILSAGSYINVNVLMEEVFRVGLHDSRLIVDPNAVIVSEDDVEEERKINLRERIGSTLTGTGAAVARRIKRTANATLAKNDNRMGQYVQPVVPYMRKNLQAGQRIIIEGTQGFGLSVLHSQYYPYVTSRDTSAAAFVSEAGLSPLDVDQVALVIRAFPIRVGGISGPLKDEIDWETVTMESGSKHPLKEQTSVTKTMRRVARFDPDIVKKAIATNQPTAIILNHLDYVDSQFGNKEGLSIRVVKFVSDVEKRTGRKIDYLGFGPEGLLKNTLSAIDVRTRESADQCG